MNLYLARHGQSELNAQKVHQFENTPLSELGRQQAQFLAERVAELPLDVILSSSYTRAKQTAEIVSEFRREKIPLVTTPLLGEVTRPSVVLGKSVYDPEVVKIKQQIQDNYHNLEWRHSDEENFVLAKTRAQACLEMLIARPEDNILAVTHGLFLALLVSSMIFGPELSSREYWEFVKHVYTKNTGLTWCTYEDGFWQLQTWNDHAHLAE